MTGDMADMVNMGGLEDRRALHELFVVFGNVRTRHDKAKW